MRVPIRLPGKQSKYRAQRMDGYASKREAKRAAELEMLQDIGKIVALRKQVPFVLIPKSKHGRAIVYVADFHYLDMETAEDTIEDAKGFKTPMYKLKKRMMAELGHIIREV